MDRLSRRGVNGKDQVVSYVPLLALKKYWTEERIRQVVNSPIIPTTESVESITKRYLRIFSILVYSGFCDKFLWFFRNNTTNVDDDDLPLDNSTFENTSEWPSSFLDHQWMFCPFQPTDGDFHQKALDLRVILPVTYGEYIKPHRAAPDGALLLKVDFNLESDSYLPMGEHVIFKVYDGNKGEIRYNAETDAHIRLQKLSNDSITKCFGSFHFPEAKRFVIILEYAEGGSLTDYLETNPPPTTPGHDILLWKPMFNLTKALDLLTAIYLQNPTSQSFVGIHQEINPDNILVFPRGKGTSRYDVQFKFKDLGMATSGIMSASDKRVRLGNSRNRIYVSPEVFKFTIHDDSAEEISHLADIWSLGAVFSDVLIWSITGESGREDYRLKRQEEISNEPRLRASKHDACFHNGTSRLTAVDKFHDYILQCKRGTDHISPRISKLIIKYMLTDRLQRLNPMQMKLTADKMINMVLNGPGDAIPVSPGSFTNGWHSPSILTCTSTPTPPPQKRATLMNHNVPITETANTSALVTVDQFYQLLEQKDRLLHFPGPRGAKADKGAEIMDLPGMQEARSKISETKGRDQIMLVDNFSSMKEHKLKAIRTARVISYIAKNADDDGMEVFAASETTKKPGTCTSSTKVEKAIKKMKTVEGRCNMYKCLDDILFRVLVPGQFRPTSIYIFTDGVWDPGDHKVELLIGRAMDFLDRHGHESSALMFQFIRFGSDPIGTKRLDYLGNQCKRGTERDNYDIVDTKYCDAHVPDIVIGSISRLHDEEK
ncbi:uncharacterized protein LW94_10633 [Fusarium fujikuroi]|nr:uncharacterized protein LW94_10633 [Fusarium fujikuroi]